jgi:hypothetical protein
MRCTFTNIEFDDTSDGIWDDGEWISWEYINQHLHDESEDEKEDEDEEWDENHSRSSPTTLQLWELLAELIESAKRYIEITGRHLPIYGELGELYGEIRYGIKRHKPNAEGSDGRMGNDFIEIKTISPHKTNDRVMVKRAGNFNKLLIVKISEEFEFESKMIDRKNLRKGDGKYTRTSWGDEDTTTK